MNALDVAALLLIAFGALSGFRSGALPQVGGIGGAIMGAGVVILGVPRAEAFLDDLGPELRAIAVLGAVLAGIGLGQVIGSGLGLAVARRLGTGILSAADRVAGMVIGTVQTLLVLWLAGGLLAGGPWPGLAEQAQRSTVIRTVSGVLPPPSDLLGELEGALHASGLPDVFLGLEPLPAPPVDGPDDPAARAIAALADDSLARVSAAACGLTLSGTAFAVGDGVFVTNAHVVAGAQAVQLAAGERADAAVVLFDPELDIAVLRAPDLRLPALRFAADDPGRGEVGVALGYPGGGDLEIIPAAVTAAYTARGRDIAGERQVTRELLELRAGVERGDSGGPFVLDDGSVGGVIFAESRTSEDVGYALTATSVAARIAGAGQRTSPVSTGPCLD